MTERITDAEQDAINAQADQGWAFVSISYHNRGGNQWATIVMSKAS